MRPTQHTHTHTHTPNRYDPHLLLPERQDQLRELGFNVVRLGAMWTGVEPRRGQRNMTYVNVLKVSFVIIKLTLYPTVQKLCRNSFFFNFLAKKTEFGRVYKPKQEFR